MVENLFSSTIKILHADGGGEFCIHLFTQFLHKHGITHRLFCPYTCQQNGSGKRKHQCIS